VSAARHGSVTPHAWGARRPEVHVHLAAVAADVPVARIGPNAILQVVEALRYRYGDDVTAAVFDAAGLSGHLASPPESMVDERDVIALHGALRARFAVPELEAVLRDAGRTTGDYLLANRIPRAAQVLLKGLPAALASRVLLQAIGRHSWTFAGSGAFSASPARGGRPLTVSISDCPMCRGVAAAAPVCDYYAATFERLFRALVHRDAAVAETACAARGDRACVFSITW
jgi:divinyl protochlorophyllide a 8-vinyl-reductase